VSHSDRLTLAVVALGVGLVVVLPLLAPGFVLQYDMVFVPRPPFSKDMLGLGRAVPRSVPSALLVAVLSRVLTGQVVEKLALLAIFAGATYGAARLVPSESRAARIAGGLLYAWNPMTYERLLLGQWAFLLGYAALPWVASRAVSLRRDEPGAAWRLVLAMALAMAPSPYTGILGGTIAVAIVLAPPWVERPARDVWRQARIVVGAAVAVNLPWLVPALLRGQVPDRPTLAVAVFRARADSPTGTLGSLASLGGLWRTDLAPAGRDTVAWIPAFVIIAGLVVVGWMLLGRRWPLGARNGLLGLAALGLLFSAAPSVAILRPAFAWLEGFLPGGGLIRDSQKFVVPLALAEAVGFGLGVERALESLPRRAGPRITGAIAFCALAVSLAPTLAWGATGKLSTANYPSSWVGVEGLTKNDPSSGAMLVLPWHAYMPFAWNPGHTVRQPATLWFSREVVASTALEVGRVRFPEEDTRSAAAAGPATDAAPLAPRLPPLGVRYVLLFKEADWRSSLLKLEGLERVRDAPDLSLYVSREPARPFPVRHIAVLPVVLADFFALGLIVVALVATVRRRP
jgi:hypothetical protein